MANEWINTAGMACYNTSTPGFPLIQEDVMDAGVLYVLNFSISGMTMGKINVPTIENALTYTEDGDYQIMGFRLFKDLVFIPGSASGGTFDGCIDNITLIEVPFYTIYDSEDNPVFELEDSTGVTAGSRYIQYNIDWSEFEEGCYYIQFESSTLTYRTDCLSLKLTHTCTKQITWNNNEDAFGFNYSELSFTQSLRIEANLWKPRYKALEKEVYEYSNGDLEITYVTKAKEFLFTTEEMPEYLHDALSLALDSDNFFIDGIKYVFPDEETSPAWRNTSSLAPIEVTLRKSQNLRNVNCG